MPEQISVMSLEFPPSFFFFSTKIKPGKTSMTSIIKKIKEWNSLLKQSDCIGMKNKPYYFKTDFVQQNTHFDLLLNHF